MAEYIKQDLHAFLEETGLITGAPDSDFSNYIQIRDQSGWKTFKDMWKGPKKAYACMGLGQSMKWQSVIMG